MRGRVLRGGAARLAPEDVAFALGPTHRALEDLIDGEETEEEEDDDEEYMTEEELPGGKARDEWVREWALASIKDNPPSPVEEEEDKEVIAETEPTKQEEEKGLRLLKQVKAPEASALEAERLVEQRTREKGAERLVEQRTREKEAEKEAEGGESV